MKKTIQLLSVMALALTACTESVPTSTFTCKDADGYQMKGQVVLYIDTAFAPNVDITKPGVDIIGIDKVEFNEQGKIISHTSFGPDGQLWDKQVYEYNDKNLLIKETVFEGEDQVSTITSYTYEGDKLRSEHTTFPQSDGVESQTFYDYDGDRLIKESCVYDPDQMGQEDTMAVSTYTYHPDSTYRVVSENFNGYETGGEGSTAIIDYNALGQKIETKGDVDGAEKNTYDPNTHLLVKSVIDEDIVQEYTYEYDEQGNWFKKTEKSDTPSTGESYTAITTRHIEYRTEKKE